LLGAASISISFLRGIALRDRKPTGLAWTAVVGFIAVGLLVIWMLLPRQGWTFRMSARKLIKDYVRGGGAGGSS
jgi:hypothetical protein